MNFPILLPKIGFRSGPLKTGEKHVFFSISKSIEFPYTTQLKYCPKLDFEVDRRLITDEKHLSKQKIDVKIN